MKLPKRREIISLIFTPLISTEKSKVCKKKASTRVSIFIFIIIHGRKTTFFVESSDSDIRKLVGNVVSEITKKTIKYEPER